MYTFKHTKDPNNQYDYSSVTFEIVEAGLTTEELVEEFRKFLLAVGYNPNSITRCLVDIDDE